MWLLQWTVFCGLVASDVAMFWWLIHYLTGPAPDASLTALLGTLVGAITTAIGLAAKDFFNDISGG